MDKIDAKILNWVKGFDVEKLIFFSDLCAIFSIIFSIFPFHIMIDHSLSMNVLLGCFIFNRSFIKRCHVCTFY